MQFKLVFRALRRISEWALEYYSEVYVTGQEHVAATGPLIIAPCHHNEIIDIATLAVNMPHRRHVCFWAKASMFGNPILRWILLSSGAIPVRRNPNSAEVRTEKQGSNANDMRTSLFRETFQALDLGEVVGLFPEGTSYTEPQIAQIKEGAARLALEHARWQSKLDHEGNPKRLAIVPVGIVYTDKSRFQSRLSVEYGEPIDIETFSKRYLVASDPESSRAVINDLTSELEKRLVALTINAPNWDTYFAACMTRDIAWKGQDNVPLKDFVRISQQFVDLFTTASDCGVPVPKQIDGRDALIRYSGLLYHTGISHDTFVALHPEASPPKKRAAIKSFARQLAVGIAHPRFWLFLPPLLVHLPGYAAGNLAAHFLCKTGEDEALAQLTVVPAGLVFGATSWTLGGKLASWMFGPPAVRPTWLPGFLGQAGDWIMKKLPSKFGLNRIVGSVGVMYLVTWVLFRWHAMLVKANLKQYRRVLASWKILLGALSSPANDITADKMKIYSRPPLPAVNPYIKQRNPSAASEHSLQSNGADSNAADDRGTRKSPPASTLIRHLFRARAEAEAVAKRVTL